MGQNIQDNRKPSISKTLKHELVHFVASIFVSIFIHYLYGNLLVTFFTFSLAMFLDGDHLLDYLLYLYKYNAKFSLKEFLSGVYFKQWAKFITPLHSWEMAIISFVLFITVLPYPIFLGVALALSSHYLVDYFTNDVNKKAYFILYRAKNNFRKASIATSV